MASLALFAKRDEYCSWYGCSNNSNWIWGRWILFVLFVVFLLFLFGFTRVVNKRRGLNGQSPIKGTSWMTPPSYFQSQRQYNQPVNPSGPSDATYVPPYSENTQPYDAGFYDNQGVFHANKDLNERAVIPDSTGMSKPSSVYHSPQAANFENDFPAFFNRQGTDQNTTELSNLRPTGPPPSHLDQVGTSGSSNPSVPPAAHSKN